MKPRLLQIGEVASQAGVTVRTVRYYLEEGFIQAADRSQGGFFLFEPHAVQTVYFIHKLKGLGFALKDIKRMLNHRRDGATGQQAYPKVLAELTRQRQVLEKKIKEYEQLRSEIDEAMDLVAQCKGCRLKPTRSNCQACPVVTSRDKLPLPFGAIL
jgi:DNA-binding transcriptional MerR regulator